MDNRKKILLINTVVVILLIVFGVMNLTGCGNNRQVVGLGTTFTKAIIKEVGEIDIKSWGYYNSENIQVTGIDGTVYLTHSSNVILKSK